MSEWVPILTHYPGKIISFNGINQLATVQVMREQYTSNLYSLYTEYEFPILQDVPVQFPSGGGYVLTFPVSPGDYCLLEFSDKGISHWLYDGADKIGTYSSGVPKAEYFRSYNINDAVAIVGFNPVTKAISNFNISSPELRNSDGSQRVTLNSSGQIEVVTPNRILLDAPDISAVGNFSVSTGATGTFTTPTGSTVEVRNGIIVNIF